MLVRQEFDEVVQRPIGAVAEIDRRAKHGFNVARSRWQRRGRGQIGVGRIKETDDRRWFVRSQRHEHRRRQHRYQELAALRIVGCDAKAKTPLNSVRRQCTTHRPVVALPWRPRQ